MAFSSQATEDNELIIEGESEIEAPWLLTGGYPVSEAEGNGNDQPAKDQLPNEQANVQVSSRQNSSRQVIMAGGEGGGISLGSSVELKLFKTGLGRALENNAERIILHISWRRLHVGRDCDSPLY